MLENGGVMTANLKQLHLVCANVNAVPHVPLEACKDNFSIVDRSDVRGIEFGDFISINFVHFDGCGFLRCRVILSVLVDSESWSQGEKVYLSV